MRLALVLATAMLIPNLALADDDDGTFDPDPKPEPPTVDLPNPAEDTETYAGVGSGIAYAERGVGEFGGSMSVSFSPDASIVSADPSIGYFLFDNFQLSGILGVRYVNVDGADSTRFSALAEPSLHLPINDGLFWVGGLGVGGAVANASNFDGTQVGLALAPRTGVQLLVGRSGLLNLGVRYSAVFSEVEADLEPLEGQAVLGFRNSFDVQAGYTVMF